MRRTACRALTTDFLERAPHAEREMLNWDERSALLGGTRKGLSAMFVPDTDPAAPLLALQPDWDTLYDEALQRMNAMQRAAWREAHGLAAAGEAASSADDGTAATSGGSKGRGQPTGRRLGQIRQAAAAPEEADSSASALIDLYRSRRGGGEVHLMRSGLRGGGRRLAAAADGGDARGSGASSDGARDSRVRGSGSYDNGVNAGAGFGGGHVGRSLLWFGDSGDSGPAPVERPFPDTIAAAYRAFDWLQCQRHRFPVLEKPHPLCVGSAGSRPKPSARSMRTRLKGILD